MGKEKSTFVYAGFIFEQIIKKSGPLIDIDHVFAKLGVALDSPDRDELLTKLPKRSVYKGPFGNVWPRWWASAVTEWCKKQFGKNGSIDRVPSAERVAQLSKSLSLPKLKSATTVFGESPFYSTICEVTRRPLSPIDGFLIKGNDLKIWQSRRYVSKEVALDPAKFAFRDSLDSIETQRIQNLRLHVRKKEKN